MVKRLIIVNILLTFFLTSVCLPLPSYGALEEPLSLPTPGTMVSLSPTYEPTLIKGMTVHKDNPFLFDFIVDTGKSGLSLGQENNNSLQEEAERLIKYFFACLTIPEKDLWVNLSPYEKDRIAPDALGRTALGRDLLAQDYILKQLTASLIYPEKGLGKEFWNKVYAKALSLYGTTEVPVNAFNKVWILADKGAVYEQGQTVLVLHSHLKVMLEEDYLSSIKHHPSHKAEPSLSSQIIREIVIPELEKEVNEGKNFAPLRQIFNSLILATWYKKNLKEALLNQVYTDRNTVDGINLRNSSVKESIYQQYLEAYKKGVFNYIKDEPQPNGSRIPRKYFSGGFGVDPAMLTIEHNPTEAGKVAFTGELVDFSVFAQTSSPEKYSDRAMVSAVSSYIQKAENPYFTDMKKRVSVVAKRFNVLQGAIEEVTQSESRFGHWEEVRYNGSSVNIFSVRVRNNTRLGPAKGGIRFLAPSDLMNQPEFKRIWEDFKKLNPNRAEIEELLKKWITQEAEALAMGMSLKNAGIGLNLGGGKGAVLIGIIKKEDNQWTMEDYPDWKNNKVLQALIARKHSLNLAMSHNVGIDIDIPAPDMNTNGETLSWYQDEYIKYIALNTNQIGDVFPDLASKLKEVSPSSNPTETPYLDLMAQYALKHPGSSLRWLGVYTGKPFEVNGINKGGVLGRGPATGEGVCDLIEAVFDKSLKGKTVAMQGFGNVVQPIGPRLTKLGAKVVVISDAGGTYIKKSGFTLEDFEILINWLNQPQNNRKMIRQAPAEVFNRDGVEIVEGDLKSTVDQESRRLAVIGAAVDILIPGALENTIKEGAEVKARYVVEAANGPTTAIAQEQLQRHGKKVYPDTLANAGGVFVSNLETQQAVTGKKFSQEEVANKRKEAIVTAFKEVQAINNSNKDLSFRQSMDAFALERIEDQRHQERKVLQGSGNGQALKSNAFPGGIDLDMSNMGLSIQKDAYGGVKVDVPSALVQEIKDKGVYSIVPLIIQRKTVTGIIPNLQDPQL